MPIKAIAWDVDGVLINSVPAIFDAACTVCDHYGVPRPTFPAFCRTLYAPYDAFWRRLGITVPYEDVEKTYHEHEVEHMYDVQLFPDVPHVLRTVQERGVPCGIVSARSAAPLQTALDQHGLRGYMSYIASDKQDKTIALQDFCQTLGHHPSEVLFIGDLLSDVRDGNSAGVTTAAFLGAYGGRETFIEHQPTFFFDTHQDILRLIV